MQRQQLITAVINGDSKQVKSLLTENIGSEEISIAFSFLIKLENCPADSQYELIELVLATNKVESTTLSYALTVAVLKENVRLMDLVLATNKIDQLSIVTAFSDMLSKHSHYDLSVAPIKILKLLLKTNKIDQDYKTAAFFRAIQNCDSQLVSILSEANGVNPSLILDCFAEAIEKKDSKRLNLLLHAVNPTLISFILSQAIEEEEKKEKEERGNLIKLLLDNIKYSSLFFAIKKQDKLLGFLVDTLGMDSAHISTIVEKAIETSNIEIVKDLLDRGMNPNLRCVSTKNTLLTAAVRCKNLEIMELLLNYKANVDFPYEEEWPTPFYIATDQCYGYSQRFLGDCMIKLLLKHGADSSLTCNGETPLGCAIRHVDSALVSLLLEHGVDPNQKSREKTPLCLALEIDFRHNNARSELVKLLLSHKADPNKTSLLNFEREYCTPLYQAVRNHQYEEIELLLSSGADSSQGETDAYLTAIQRYDLNAFKIFINHQLKKEGPIDPVYTRKGSEWLKYNVNVGKDLMDSEFSFRASEYAENLYIITHIEAYKKMAEEIQRREKARKSARQLAVLSLFNVYNANKITQENKNKYPDQYPKEQYPELWPSDRNSPSH